MLPDPRDEEFARTAGKAIAGMLDAVETGDRLRLIGELNLLLAAIVERGNAGARRDTALARAIRIDRRARPQPVE